MFQMKSPFPLLQSGLIVLLLAAALPPRATPAETEQLQEEIAGTMEIHLQIQQQQDKWAGEMAALKIRYETAKANVAFLQKQRTVNAEKDVALSDAIHELQRRLRESVRLKTCLQDSINTVLCRLDRWVENDLPFLLQERNNRLNDLHSDFARPETTTAEKLRRLLEALQIETSYGETVEVYPQWIDIDGQSLFVDVLRIGTVSLFWRTADGARAGQLNPATGCWADLPDKYKRPISVAMGMATNTQPIDLISLPLGRINR